MLNDCVVLKAETETCMRLLGVEKVSELGPKHVSCLPSKHSVVKLIEFRLIHGLWKEMSMMATQG